MTEETPQPSQNGFHERYELPEDQMAAEFALIDEIKDQFPDQIEALEYNLDQIKRFAGFDIPSGLIPVEGHEDNPNRLPLDENGNLILGNQGLSKLYMQMPAVDMQKEDFEKLGQTQQTIYQMEKGGLIVAGELPIFTKKMLDGIYGLVGATVEDIKSDSQGRAVEILRKGTYHGSPIYIRQSISHYETSVRKETTLLETFTSATILSPSLIKAHQDSAVLEETRKIIDSTPLG